MLCNGIFDKDKVITLEKLLKADFSKVGVQRLIYCRISTDTRFMTCWIISFKRRRPRYYKVYKNT